MASKAKTLYHSELVSRGIVELQITGIPTASKFAGKPDFVGVILDGEERLLTLENEAIKEFFSGQKGQTFHVKATGGKGNATIQFVEDPTRPAPPPRQAPPPTQNLPATASQPAAPPQTAPPQQSAPQRQPGPNGTHEKEPTQPPTPQDTPAAKIDRVKRAQMRLANLLLISKSAARQAMEDFERQTNRKFAPGEIEAAGTSIYIEAARKRHDEALPAGCLDWSKLRIEPEDAAPFNPQEDSADNFDDGGRE